MRRWAATCGDHLGYRPLVARRVGDTADADDRDHGRSVALIRRTPPPLLMPAPVLTEVRYLLERERRGAGRGGIPTVGADGARL